MSAKNFFYTKAALGMKPFVCHICGGMLVRKLIPGGTTFELELDCRNCKTNIQLRAKNPIPVSRMLKGEDISELQQHYAESVGGRS